MKKIIKARVEYLEENNEEPTAIIIGYQDALHYRDLIRQIANHPIRYGMMKNNLSAPYETIGKLFVEIIVDHLDFKTNPYGISLS